MFLHIKKVENMKAFQLQMTVIVRDYSIQK
jgi:hypothetical protein